MLSEELLLELDYLIYNGYIVSIRLFIYNISVLDVDRVIWYVIYDLYLLAERFLNLNE